jgi:hypothetical protein
VVTTVSEEISASFSILIHDQSEDVGCRVPRQIGKRLIVYIYTLHVNLWHDDIFKSWQNNIYEYIYNVKLTLANLTRERVVCVCVLQKASEHEFPHRILWRWATCIRSGQQKMVITGNLVVTVRYQVIRSRAIDISYLTWAYTFTYLHLVSAVLWESWYYFFYYYYS